MLKKILITMMTILLMSCQSGMDIEDIGSIEQPLINCTGAPGNWLQTIDNVNLVEIVNTNVIPDCLPEYYSYEPHSWSYALNAVPPKRASGNCSCSWTNIGLCFNSVTGDLSQEACQNGACNYYRAFECGYGPGCAYKISYSFSPASAATLDFKSSYVFMYASEPNGCIRLVHAHTKIILPKP